MHTGYFIVYTTTASGYLIIRDLTISVGAITITRQQKDKCNYVHINRYVSAYAN